ncbi:MAG: ABC transporter permease [Acidobacteriota bacterium]
MIRLIAITEIRRLLAQPFSIGIWIGIPLLIGSLMAVIGLAGGGEAPRAKVLLVDPGESITGGLLRTASGQNDSLDIEQVDEKNGRERLDNGEATALLILPERIDRALLDAEPTTIELVVNPEQRILPGLLTTLTDTMLDVAWTLRRLLDEPIESLRQRESIRFADVAELAPEVDRLIDSHLPPLLELEVVATETQREPARVFFGVAVVPGLVVMALLFAAGGISDDLWRDRDSGTLARYLAGPGHISVFLTGKLLGATTVLLGLVVIGLPIAVWKAQTGLTGVFPTLIALTMLSVVFTVVFMLIHTFATSRQSGSMLTTLITFPLLMVGGSFFPLAQLPGLIGQIGRWTPNGRTLVMVEDALRGQLDMTSFLVLVLALGTVIVISVIWLGQRLTKLVTRG